MSDLCSARWTRSIEALPWKRLQRTRISITLFARAWLRRISGFRSVKDGMNNHSKKKKIKKSPKRRTSVMKATQCLLSVYSSHDELRMLSNHVCPPARWNTSIDRTSAAPKLPYKWGNPSSHFRGFSSFTRSSLTSQSLVAFLKNKSPVSGTL